MKKLLAKFNDRGLFHPFDQVAWLKLAEKYREKVFWFWLEDEDIKRTKKQNDFIQPLARELAEYTGESMRYEKDRAVLNALGPEIGLEARPIVIEIDGKRTEIRRVRSTADLNVIEATAVIDWLLNLYKDLGLRAPGGPDGGVA